MGQEGRERGKKGGGQRGKERETARPGTCSGEAQNFQGAARQTGYEVRDAKTQPATQEFRDTKPSKFGHCTRRRRQRRVPGTRPVPEKADTDPESETDDECLGSRCQGGQVAWRDAEGMTQPLCVEQCREPAVGEAVEMLEEDYA